MDGSVATIPIFDVKAILVAFLNDPLLMHEENFIPNYDIFTRARVLDIMSSNDFSFKFAISTLKALQILCHSL
jgi:hypothetical protein